MAVINSPQIGIARGKLGDAVYYRSKGNTNARSYNPNTTNRRTVRQQSQRAVFSSSVKFFARGTQNLFVFAFEDKRTQESDYNAFMRYNTKRGIYFGPEQNENPAYPALGNWIMTHGSLPRIDYKRGSEGFEIDLLPAAGVGDVVTVGQLSSQLLTDPAWAPGDIFTIVSVGSDSLVGTPYNPVRVGSSEPYWVIKQFIVDESDPTNLDTLGLEFKVQGIRQYLTYSTEYPLSILGIEGFAVIHSRTVNGQLRVSDSTMIYNPAGDTAIEYGQGDSWKDIVLAAWGSEQLSILQGGVARRSSESYTPQVILTFPLDYSVEELQDQMIIISGLYDIATIAAHMKFVDDDGTILQNASVTTTAFQVMKGADLVMNLSFYQTDGNSILRISTTDSGTPDLVFSSIYWE